MGLFRSLFCRQKPISGRFFGAIHRNGEVKVAPIIDEVSRWFKSKGLGKNLIWFEGSVNVDLNHLSFKLSDENGAMLTPAQNDKVTMEVTCFVAYYFAWRGVVPGTVKGTIVDFVNKVTRKNH